MLSFLILRRGDTLADARTVAVTCDPGIVSAFAERLLERERPTSTAADQALAEIEKGTRKALRVIAREGEAVAR